MVFESFVYIGVFALLLNLIVVGIGMAIMKGMNKVKEEGTDQVPGVAELHCLLSGIH